MAGKITKLKVQKRNKERVNVYLDGEFAFGLAMIEAVKLKKGQHLSDEDIARLKALDDIEKAHNKALNFLSYRPRSVEEVRRNLSKKYPETVVETVLERLERAGLLDDVEFTRFWVENRDRFKPRGARALRHELRRKGVSDRIIDEALMDLDAEDAALRAAEKGARRYKNEDEWNFRRKMKGYLARRGFSYRIIRDVIDRVWEDINQQDY